MTQSHNYMLHLHGDCSWFTQQSIRKNKLGSILKSMSEAAGVTVRKVNNSARKATVTSFLHSNIAPTLIIQITGHKNVHSVNNYSSASIPQKK
ncbi:hypothetical protein KUTeg_020837 [Tegillarca granosa]|uniref:Tyr recombinase domain-containing protein n=1 Tax=Tegillarca granosa TaxID=220873 RepID=A0ABQ9E9L0_TEGGR|nr:hypothetical protein KUTeg_020837 [Tegillarca granosa]